MSSRPSPASPSSSLFLRSLRGEATPTAPIWLMRQAGRYLPEYRALRAEAGSFMKLCFTPDYAVEVTLQPLRRFDLDAAILFSDILVVPHALGQTLSFVEGEGPKLIPYHRDALSDHDFHAVLSPVYETVTRLRATLPADKALIGFAGAPWTIACYMLQGEGNGAFEKAFAMADTATDEFDALLSLIARKTADYLIRQIKAGADCVQLFDSWAGLAAQRDTAFFNRVVIRPTIEIVDAVRAACPGVPVIGFPRKAGVYYRLYCRGTGVNGLGMDPAAPFKDIPRSVAVQGKLDPELLLKGGEEMEIAARAILTEAGTRPFIFNLGHGVIKETPVDHVARLVDIVKGFKRA